MTIAFNFLPYGSDQHGGAAVYLFELASAYAQRYDDDEVLLYGNWDRLAKLRHRHNVKQRVVRHQLLASRTRRILYEQTAFCRILAIDKPELLISNYVSPLCTSAPRLTVVHDMLLRDYPSMMERTKRLYWKIIMPCVMRASVRILTVSEFSRDRIVHHFPALRDRVDVVQEGVKHELASAASHPLRSLAESEFFLIVSSFAPHKNLKRALEAFARLPEPYDNYRLAIVGSAATPDARIVLDEIEHAFPDLKERVLLSGHVSESTLAWLYENAVALVFPSLYEGFGLPVIEAQYYGCPVLCSSTSSLPEIAGGAALLFDPTDVDEIRDSMRRIVEEENIRADFVARGHSNVKRYGWSKAAEQLRDVIEGIRVLPQAEIAVSPSLDSNDSPRQ